MEPRQDQLLLRKLGIRVPLSQVPEVMSTLKTESQFQKEIEKAKKSLETMVSEQKFLEKIVSSHQSIAGIQQNHKVIQDRDNTFIIRAINPEDIKSLTERAFFNSFNLERNVMNDLEEETKLQKQISYRGNKQTKQRYNGSQENFTRNRRADEADQEEKCICGKHIPGSEWVQCINEDKCRGSNWYHLECAGFELKDLENIKDKDFVCERCRREEDGDDESQSQSRKRVKEDESAK